MMKSLTATDMKHTNVINIKKSFFTLEEATSRDIQDKTGLTFATVKGIIDELVSDNILIEKTTLPSGGGRPAKLYGFNEKRNYFLTVAFSRNTYAVRMEVRVVDLMNAIIDSTSLEMKTFRIEAVMETLELLLKKYPNIHHLAIAAPGVASEHRFVENDIQALINVDFRSVLNSPYDLEIFLENDVNAALYSDTSETKDLVSLFFPEDDLPGSAIMNEGKILKGSRGFAGEIGRLPLGIDWLNNYKLSAKEYAADIVQILVYLSYIVDPSLYTIYGKRIDEKMTHEIKKQYYSHDSSFSMVEIEVKEDMQDDILCGLYNMCISHYLLK